MTRPLSPIHRSLDSDDVTPTAPSRFTLLAQLDQRALSGRPFSLGPGGASSVFARAVERALVEEMAEQLRGRAESVSEVGRWAADIIAAFKEKG